MKLSHILIASFAASALFTSATSARAQSHLDAAADLVDHITPSYNEWGSDCTMAWGNWLLPYANKTVAACFFTLTLKHAHPEYTDDVLKTWWNTANPSSPKYYDIIAAENRFDIVSSIHDIEPGDLIVLKYSSGGNLTGHTMIVEDAPVLRPVATSPIVSGTSQYEVGILDSTSSPHGISDSRYSSSGSDQGAGRGLLRVYANSSGTMTGHTWSTTAGSTYYSVSTRQLIVGRFTGS